MEISDDETDYKMLAPQSSPRRSILVTSKDKSDNDLDDSDDEPIAAAKPRAKLAAPKAAKAAPRDKKSAPAKKSVAKKIQPQSPAAKAYAKRLAKKVIEDDSDDALDVDAIADEMLSSDDDVHPAKDIARPARRAAASKPKKTYDFDDDEDDFGDENSDESQEVSLEDEDDD